ncbi:hypothetical protein CVT25_008103 [Psilocybe cyanescens]|uniref:CCHC-type domain-containing protein n=1 Tax=Psilocybe cyanescens TaxID=93625 RepID=A0A409X6N9_PSICY|nr:hypothetical protein CVT25_008103 [Psilocybe cyanescens]
MNTISGTARNRKATPANGTSGSKDATKTPGQQTRANGPAELVEGIEVIKGSKDGRVFLKKRQLLVPEGHPLTMAMAGSCLHQVMELLPNVPLLVMQGMRALAYLMEDADQEEATQTYHNGFNSELEFFMSELTQLIKHTQTKVDAKLEEISKVTEDLAKSVRTLELQRRNTMLEPVQILGQPSYSQILSQLPTSTSPKMLARHGIRWCQLMLKGIRSNSSIEGLGDHEICDKLNRALKESELAEIHLCSATKQRNGGLLVEFDLDYGAAWGRKGENIAKICQTIGKGVEMQKRSYQLIAKFVPLSVEPGDPNFIGKVEESNRMEAGVITSMRWAKAVERQKANQKWAHIILSTDNVNKANQIIALGIYIANKKVTVEKCKVDPIRCMKCQGYNYYAKDCSAVGDICGQCSEKGHQTKECSSQKKYCILCASGDHTSYNRMCPTFQKKAADKNLVTPENTLPFIPMDEPWTWSTNPDVPPGAARQDEANIVTANPHQQSQKNTSQTNT